MNVHIKSDRSAINEQVAREIATLSSRMKGYLVAADHPDYDAIRGIASSNWDRRPMLIARVANAADVADVVDFARRNQLEIAVRSGGHSVCGHSASEGGVVIDLRDLQELSVDSDAMTVWAGSGLTAGQVIQELEPRGLIVGFGDAASVGIGGITLGGGVGYLTRKFGLTIDSLIAAEIVTASGSILVADENHHPELFWALRGGGGNFGVVTRFCYRLNHLPDFVGGPLILPATPEVLSSFLKLSKAAPDELTTILLAMPAPPMPFLPPDLHGKTVLMGMMAFAGNMSDAEAVLAPFRSLATPIADLVRPGNYSMMFTLEDAAMKPALSVRTLFKDNIDVSEAAEILARVEACTAPMRLAQIRVLGGAAARVPIGKTAYAHRHDDLLVGFLAMDGSAEAASRNDIWASDCVAALGGATKGSYVNFLAEEGEDMTRAAYPGPTWERLRRVKRDYDPQNLFRLNQNIPPA